MKKGKIIVAVASICILLYACSKTVIKPLIAKQPIIRINATSNINYTFDIHFYKNTNIQIDWGDGTIDSFTGDQYYSPNHTYNNNGNYNISIIVQAFELKNVSDIFTQNIPVTEVENFNSFDKIQSLFIQMGNLILVPTVSNSTNVLELRNNQINDLSSINFTSDLKILVVSSNKINSLNNVSLPSKIEDFNIEANNLNIIGNFLLPTKIRKLDMSSNNINTSDVSNILVQLVNNNQFSGYVRLNYQTPVAPLNSAGLAAKTALLNRGWTVITD